MEELGKASREEEEPAMVQVMDEEPGCGVTSVLSSKHKGDCQRAACGDVCIFKSLVAVQRRLDGEDGEDGVARAAGGAVRRLLRREFQERAEWGLGCQPRRKGGMGAGDLQGKGPVTLVHENEMK